MNKLSRSLAVVAAPLLAVLLLTAACGMERSAASETDANRAARESAALKADSLAKATFAGGCFWCVESAFQEVPGVKAAVSGFAGGTKPNPTYKEVGAGRTNHAESVQVAYDPDVVSYEQLLDVYWHDIDPTDAGGQFADRGSQYRPIIFYRSERQHRLARQSKQELAKNGPFDEPIVVSIEPLDKFYAAQEDYHQDFYKTHPKRYKQYFEASGRGPFLRKTWGKDHGSKATTSSRSSNTSASQQHGTARVSGSWATRFEKPAKAMLKDQLTPMQYEVTQQNGTEPAYQNKYYDNERAGIYVDVVSGEPLFSSKAKFHSGTGWPSFYKPISSKFVVKKKDHSMGMTRTEVRSRYADSHLGHIFAWNREPSVPTGKRYCIDSAALHFIPADKLEEKGYGQYAKLFE